MEGAYRADQPREGDRSLSEAGARWSGASYERIAEAFTPVHERIVATLAPAPGDRFLDLACGTGGVALVAARAGAEVTGLDISADQLAKARAAAEAAGVAIRFDEGDCQDLPYEDGSFDQVASAFGMIFAPDHEQAAAELIRVCRPGGRVAITAWFVDDWAKLGARLRPGYEGVDAAAWSSEDHVRRLLSGFDVSFERGDATIAAGSADELWQLLATSVPPLKAWLDGMDDAGRERGRLEYLPLLREGRLTRDYLLILGTRR